MNRGYNPNFLAPARRLVETIERLRNPFHTIVKRAFGKSDQLMTIVDRRTGVACQCTVGSFHMFGSTWYSREYDVPYVPIREGDVVLDVGANQGFFTCYAASLGARVFAFEPNPESFETLERNIEKNHFADRVTARAWAISDENRRTKLIVSNELGGGMSTIDPVFARNTSLIVKKTFDVECRTLASVLELFSLRSVRLCKIDAEGSETAILRTITETALPNIDSFAMEVHPEAYRIEDLTKIIFEWGTHQIGFNDTREFSSSIMRLISNRLLSGTNQVFNARSTRPQCAP
jgi:FkbM family methyltransferase